MKGQNKVIYFDQGVTCEDINRVGEVSIGWVRVGVQVEAREKRRALFQDSVPSRASISS